MAPAGPRVPIYYTHRNRQHGLLATLAIILFVASCPIKAEASQQSNCSFLVEENPGSAAGYEQNEQPPKRDDNAEPRSDLLRFSQTRESFRPRGRHYTGHQVGSPSWLLPRMSYGFRFQQNHPRTKILIVIALGKEDAVD